MTKQSLAYSSIDSERSYFDGFVSENGEFNPFTQVGWDTLRQRFIEMIRPAGSESLLDVGCGTGCSLQIYEKNIREYTGIDLSSEAVARAQQKFPKNRWLVGDACDLPFADNSFDIVAFSSVLHHIPDFTAAVKEAHRVLKPGGAVFAFDPNLLHPAMALFRHPKSPLYIQQGVSPNERPLYPAELRSSFERSSFESINQRAQSRIPYKYVAPRVINFFISSYNIVDQFWEAIGMGKVFGTFIITAARRSKG